MLTLAQALLAKPRLLMIDELSLGLAPVIVEQLLETVRRLAEEGTTIILVEQSVNIALTVADTAYFMEKGEIRFHGPTSELLERPDVLRSVFLEGAGSITGVTKKPAARARRAELAPGNGSGAVAAAPILQVTGLTKRFGGVTANDDVTFDLFENQILGLIGPNGAGKTTLFDIISGFTPPDAGHIMLNGAGHHRRGARCPRPAGSRPFVPGRPPLPRPHRGRDHRPQPREACGCPRSAGRGPQPARRRAVGGGHPGKGRGAGSR